MIKTVSGYRFSPEHLAVRGRIPGISAFLRTRNGKDFIEQTIRSHITFYDEIVVVFNRCDDGTPDILRRLNLEFPHKLRVYDYLDAVHPPGSRGHVAVPPDDPTSMVNYSNFALAQTRYQIVVKLDDDHIAIPEALSRITTQLRSRGAEAGVLYAFSGFNLAEDLNGRVGVLAAEPFSGNGDIAYFRPAPSTYFKKDTRFERFNRQNMKIRFVGFAYWHMKYMKEGNGFKNYDLEEQPQSRFQKKLRSFLSNRSVIVEISKLAGLMKPSALHRGASRWSDKVRFAVDRYKNLEELAASSQAWPVSHGFTQDDQVMRWNWLSSP
jgi:glycosyltransferase involved in cell wall biosynthesis